MNAWDEFFYDQQSMFQGRMRDGCEVGESEFKPQNWQLFFVQFQTTKKTPFNWCKLEQETENFALGTSGCWSVEAKTHKLRLCACAMHVSFCNILFFVSFFFVEVLTFLLAHTVNLFCKEFLVFTKWEFLIQSSLRISLHLFLENWVVNPCLLLLVYRWQWKQSEFSYIR